MDAYLLQRRRQEGRCVQCGTELGLVRGVNDMDLPLTCKRCAATLPARRFDRRAEHAAGVARLDRLLKEHESR